MLDKLNQIASLVSDLIGGAPAKKSKKAAMPDDEEEADADALPSDKKAARVQKSIRKSTGGEQEPGC